MKSVVAVAVLVLLAPFAAWSGERLNLPSKERLRLMENCCVPSAMVDKPSAFSAKGHRGLRKIIKERRILMYAFDTARPENGRLDVGKHGKSFGIIYKKEAGILE